VPKPEVCRQLSIATGSRSVFPAGQVAWDAEGSPVGDGDLAAQVEQAYLNIATAPGGNRRLVRRRGDADRLRRRLDPDKMPMLGEGVARAAVELGVDPVKPITLLGVAALGESDLLGSHPGDWRVGLRCREAFRRRC
jgi:hypothetical protein